MDRISSLIFCLGLCLLIAAAPESSEKPGTRPWLVEPVGPLDPRIDPQPITEGDLPPLPDAIVQPMPPSFRIADSADEAALSEDSWVKAMHAIDRGLEHLRRRQGEDGTWMRGLDATPTDQPENTSPVALATTSMAVQAFAQRGHELDQDANMQTAVTALLSTRAEDGTIDAGALSNYVSAAMVSGIASLDDDRFRDAIQEGVASLAEHQWDQDEGIGTRADWFGGAGYGPRGRPDLSNTQAMLQAMHDSGMSPDDPAFQKAVVFLSRTQNLESVNDAAWAANDGGFVYTPANGGESMASEYAGEGRHGELLQAGRPRSLRSYGSMTYAGFKSLIHAGLTADDPRVQAAYNWLRTNYTFDSNPGVGQQGLYYYYLAMARALRAAQQPIITDSEGVAHDWRKELVDAIVSRQRADGSWVNGEERWMEGHDELVTVYSVLALEEILKPAPLARARRTSEP